MDTKFYSKKSRSVGIFLISVSVFCALVTLSLPIIMNDNFDLTEFIIPGMLVILVAGLYLWVWNGTNYQINNDIL